MAAPQADQEYPLEAKAIPLASLLDSTGGCLDGGKLQVLVKQALQVYQSSAKWSPGKTFAAEHSEGVHTFKGRSSSSSKRLQSCAWHARSSQHKPQPLGYEDFYEGLFIDRPQKEAQYIHDIIQYDKVQGVSLRALPCSPYISHVNADVWLSKCTLLDRMSTCPDGNCVADKLPIFTSNRDFVELLISVDFAPHEDPLGDSHIEQILASFQEGQLCGVPQQTHGRKSSMNIQLPVSTDQCSVQPGFLRAYYASIEIIRQCEENKGTNWW